MRLKCFIACLGSMVAVVVGSVRASDQIGVYCIVEKVVLETIDAKPVTAQVWGAFSFAIPGSFGREVPANGFGIPGDGSVYGPVQVGYLYYTCATATDVRCANEWNDLKSTAGKGTVMGIGGRYARNGRVRPAAEAKANPDVYPLNIGVIPVGRPNPGQYPDLIKALAAALLKK